MPMYRYTRPPLPIDLLLGRWGLQTLNRLRFLAVLRFLMQYGLRGTGFSLEEVAEMIVKHTETHPFVVESCAVVKGRGLFLDALLDGRTAPETNKVLDWLLIKTARTVDSLRIRYGQALDRLVAAGAVADTVRVADGSLSCDDGVILVMRERSPG